MEQQRPEVFNFLVELLQDLRDFRVDNVFRDIHRLQLLHVLSVGEELVKSCGLALGLRKLLDIPTVRNSAGTVGSSACML